MEKLTLAVLFFVPFLFSLSVHEYAHAAVADHFGDDTARLLGRKSLSPLVHLDPYGSVIFPLLAFFTGLPLFGWAKPVPVNFNRLKDPFRDNMFVALAGPLSNLLLALGFTLTYGIVIRVLLGLGMSPQESGLAMGLDMMLRFGIRLNLILALFNLLPLPPLDGSRILAYFLPGMRQHLWQLERYGLFILLGLMFLGLLRPLVFAPSQFLYGFLLNLVI